jgi:hypothetical protein
LYSEHFGSDILLLPFNEQPFYKNYLQKFEENLPYLPIRFAKNSKLSTAEKSAIVLIFLSDFNTKYVYSLPKNATYISLKINTTLDKTRHIKNERISKISDEILLELFYARMTSLLFTEIISDKIAIKAKRGLRILISKKQKKYFLDCLENQIFAKIVESICA